MKPVIDSPLLKALLISASHALTTTAFAAPITWSGATTISGDSDVSTLFSGMYAYNWANSTRTVNGVTFTGTASNTSAGADITLTGWGNVNINAFNSGSNPFNSLSADYKAMLIGSTFNNSTTGSYGTNTVALNGLQPGREYLVQFWVNDPRNIGINRTEAVSSTGGNTVTLAFPGNSAGATGQYTLGTFTADATTQAFTVTTVAGSNSIPQMNAIQLRDVTHTGSWTGSIGTSWDESATNNWALNSYNAALSTGTFSAAMTDLGTGNWAIFRDSYYNNGTPTAVTNSNLAIAAGGVSSASKVIFDNSAVGYSLSSADATGLAGTASLLKKNSGVLTLAGANTYTGGTNLNGGTLNINHANALGTGPIAISAGTTLGTTAGSPVVNTGDNAQNWNGNFSFTGGDLNLGSGSVTINTNATVNTTAGTLTVGGSVSNATRNLTKTGAGTLSFSGAVALNNLDIQQGAVVFDGGSYTCNNGSGGWGLWLRNTTTSSLTVKNDAAINILNGFQIQQGTATIESGSITAVSGATAEIYLGNSANPANLTIKGGIVTARVMSFGNGGSAATLNLEGGTLVWNNAPYKPAGTATLNMGGGMLKPGGSFTIPATLPFTLTGTNGSLTIDTQAHTTTLANLLTGAGGLTKDGSGTLVIASANSDYTGSTLVSAGGLYVNGSLGSTAITVGDAGTIGGGGILGGSLTIADGGTLDVSGATLGLDGISTGVLTLNGNLVLSNFGFDDILGWDYMNAADGTYSLMSGVASVSFGGSTPTQANPFNFGNGRKGYFEQGSLRAIIVPEPSSTLLGGLALLATLRRRRTSATLF